MKIQIPVETLDDERLTNIERRIVAGAGDRLAIPGHAPRRSLAFAGVAVAMAASALIGWRLHGDGAPVIVTTPPQLVAIDRGTLDLGDAKLSGDAVYDVARTAGRIDVKLVRGKLELAVAHRADRLLVVHAGDTDVEDVGTRFSVDYDGASRVDVRVTEGKVKVTRGQRSELVEAGHDWSSTGTVAVAAVGAPPVEVAAPPAPELLHPRHAAVPEAPASSRPAVVASRPTPVVEPRPHAAPPPPADPYVDLKLAIRRQPLAFDPGIDGKSDAATEIAKLKKIAYSSTTLGGDASLATYRIAVLLHRPLGQDTEALRTLEIYRRRFAGGTEHSAAAWLRVRILCGHTLDDECRKAAYSYQHEVTTGEAADVAIRITNAQ